MFCVSRIVAPLALVAGMAFTTTIVSADSNQPPFGKGGKGFGKGGDDKKKVEDKKDDKKVEDKKGERKGEKKVEDKKAAPAPKSDAIVDAWLAVLLTKITDPHDTVRDSARGAIVAVGSAAVPVLQKLADGDDPAKAVAARKMIASIQGHGRGTPAAHTPPGPGGPPGKGPRESGPPGKGGREGFGPPGMGGRGGLGGPGGRRGPGREEEGEIEVAPMPRDVSNG